MDILIIGAGAAGLMAANELAQKGQRVTVLEARNRLGGRIYTINEGTNSYEGGAEFVHGNLEVTLNTLKKAGIKYTETTGELWRVDSGNWKQENGFLEHADILLSKLKSLTHDVSITEFLQREFSEERYSKLRKSLLSYVEGYYAGDPNRTSAMAFLKEWESEDEQQYRIEGGYGRMIQYLADQFKKLGGIIQLSTVVKEVKWLKNQVEVLDDALHSYSAHKIIVTVPLGIWRSQENARGFIKFTPALSQKISAANQTGWGSAIKILLQFTEAFWENKKEVRQTHANLKDLGFVISDATIPTWWTQLPTHAPLLTGWLGGPKAEFLKEEDDKIILEHAIRCLHQLFGISEETLQQKLVICKVFNWPADPFTRGAYAYSTIKTQEARKKLMASVEQTLFFAGDGFYDGNEAGTVEAALVSGKKTAAEVVAIEND